MYINYTNNEYIGYKYILYNILTNEYIEIGCKYKNLKEIVDTIFSHKYVSRSRVSDKDFLLFNKNLLNKI